MGTGMVKEFIQGGSSEIATFNLTEILVHVGNSLLLGIILSIVTYITTTLMLKLEKNEELGYKKIHQLIFGSANILYLTVGLTGIMLLVNNNLARAFAIGASLALVRFRVKLSQKAVDSNFLFGIITGIACGLKEITLGWVITIVYILLQTSLYLIVKSAHKDEEIKV